MSTLHDDEEAVVAAFLRQVFDDRSAGRHPGLDCYLEAFPGREGLIREAWGELEGSRAGAVEAIEEPAGAEALPRHVGPYRLIDLLGAGGQGEVWLAEDTRHRRKVAVKVLHALAAASEELRARFRREAFVASKLDHPGICPLYDSGSEGAIPYLVMRHVEGEPLSRLIARRRAGADRDRPAHADGRRGSWTPVTLPEGVPGMVRLLEEAARAVHAAHEGGVFHRDLKPANIMVTPRGEPVILDFGVARVVEGDASYRTRTGDVFGTPAYLAPELLETPPAPADRRTDVYALGVTLYEALTGKRPFEAPTRDGLYQAILRSTPADPRACDGSIPRDLAAVVLTAIDRDRDRRYQTAADLADDLRRVLAREPVRARPPSAWSVVRGWMARNRVVALLAGALFLALFLGLAVALGLLHAVRAKAAEAAESLDGYNRLADGLVLEDLLRREDQDLWPAAPEKVPLLEEWLKDACALLRRFQRHEETLAEMRSRALPWTDAARARDRASYRQEQDRLAAMETECHLTRLALEALDTDHGAAAGAGHRRGILESNLEVAETRLEEEKVRLEPVLGERVTWEFADAADQWRHGKLADLVRALRAFGADPPPRPGIRSVEERLDRARTLRKRTIEDQAGAWAACLRRLAAHPAYGAGVMTAPVVGLIPLGPDPRSTFEEFAETATGTPPGRDPETGDLVFGEDSALVFVLLPGGTFTMGAQAKDPARPDFDPQAAGDEGPPREVTVAPFLLSKFEMTQGQWIRFTGSNPSYYKPEGKWGADLSHPVGFVSWDECRRTLGRLGARLPTEAQWEYACRAGTKTPFHTGHDASTLAGAENIADEGSREHFAPDFIFEKGLSDGWPFTSPAGAFRPNAFGVHDMHGNVVEWCDDDFTSYGFPGRAGDGLRRFAGLRQRASRGGSHLAPAIFARSSARSADAPTFKAATFGLRPALDFPPR